MAKLSDFLGGLANGITDARVNSDLQSLQVAKYYSNDTLLKHFSVPRLRIDKVELNIPVAVNNLSETIKRVYQPLNTKSFSSTTNQQVFNALPLTKLTSPKTKLLQATLNEKLDQTILESIKSLESELTESTQDSLLNNYAENIALKSTELVSTFYKENKISISSKELTAIKSKISKGLESSLKDQFVTKADLRTLDFVDVIVESDKLREIKPENVIMIKMTLSEQGMEWIATEDKNGDVVNKLMPE